MNGTYSKLLQSNQSAKVKIHPTKAPERNSERTKFRTEKRSENRTVTKPKPDSQKATLPIKRQTKRYSFEFYDDQLTKLRQLKIEAEMRGERIVLSEMVRQAFDEYLKGRD